jgi:hypothetical protein
MPRIKTASPWACPFAGCGYAAESRRGRAGHLRILHGVGPPSPATDEGLGETSEPSEQPATTSLRWPRRPTTLASVTSARRPNEAQGVLAMKTESDIAARMARLETKFAGHQLKPAQGSPPRRSAPPLRAPEIPDFDELIAHCEDGRCESHESQWAIVKERIVTEAWDQMPEAQIRELARDLGLVDLSEVVVRPG